MHATARLQQFCRITLFTRPNCSLCLRAKSALSKVWDDRPFQFHEVDVIMAEAPAWRNLYALDVPVIHISRISAPEEDPERASEAVKLMHRFSPEDVHAKMDLVAPRDERE